MLSRLATVVSVVLVCGALSCATPHRIGMNDVLMNSVTLPDGTVIVLSELGEALKAASGADDPLAANPIEYDYVGFAKYDNFFQQSAVMNGTVVVGKMYADATVKSLQSYCKGANSDLPPDQQGVACVKAMKGSMSPETAAALKKTAASTLALSLVLTKATTTAIDLVNQGNQLSQSVTTDFIGMNAIKVPGVTTGLTRSIGNLNNAVQTLPGLAKELTVLSQGIAAAF